MAAKLSDREVLELQWMADSLNGRKLQPEDVVEAAKDPKSALHVRFEWDDTVAAQKYRNHIARQVIERFRVISRPETDEEISRVVRLVPGLVSRGEGYGNIHVVMNEPSEAQEQIEYEWLQVRSRFLRFAAICHVNREFSDLTAAAEQTVREWDEMLMKRFPGFQIGKASYSIPQAKTGIIKAAKAVKVK